MSTSIPTLLLSPGWNAVEAVQDNTIDTALGDGYSVNGATSIHPSLSSWEISRVGLRREEVEEIVDQLKLWGGVTAFNWSPLPGELPSKQYFADTWSIIPIGPDVFEIQIKLIPEVRGECLAFRSLIDESAIASQLIGASSFLTSFTNDSTYLINSDNNLALRSLHTHSEQIPSNSGTLYDQITLALGCLNAYELTDSSIWLTRATNYTQAIVDNYYNSDPEDGSIYLPHWLYDLQNDRLEDIYPTLRTLNTDEVNAVIAHMPVLWELYSKLYNITEDEQWQALANTTRTSATLSAQFSNRTYVYRKNSGSVTEYPGTQISGSATRQTTGSLTNYVRVQGSSALIVQNLETQVALENLTIYLVETASSVANQILEFFVSTSTDDSSDAQLYRQFFRLGAANTSATKEITRLYKYDDLAWHYGVGLVSGTALYETQTIASVEQAVLRLDADAELSINKSDRNPFKIQAKVETSPAILRLRDGEGRWWEYTLPVGDWTAHEPTWADFTWSPINTLTQGSNVPSTTADIQALRIVTSGRIYIWWVGANTIQPIPRPTMIYRAGVADRGAGSRSFYVGDVYSPDTPSDLLPYTPGVVPFARNIVEGVSGKLTGLPYSGYQNVYGWVEWNQPEYVANVVRFLKDAQAAYSRSTDDTGPFAPVFTWNDIDNINQGGDLNRFGFEGFDDLAISAEYQAQVSLWLAKSWNANRSNSELRDLAMSWLRWLDQVYSPREAELPPNLFPEDATAVPGHNPGVQALIGEAALWCNLAGGDPAVTFRWIYRTLEYLNDEFVLAGNPMSGSWSASQLSFSGTLKEYYSWWHGACLNTYSLFVLNKDNITYPPCSEPLEIPTSEPLPEVCCGAPLIACGMGILFDASSSLPTNLFTECRVDVNINQESAGLAMYFGINASEYLGIASNGTLEL